MRRCSLDEDQAFEAIRTTSMQRNLSIEELCIALVSGELSSASLQKDSEDNATKRYNL
jgi:hypothetical protein